MEEQKLQKGIIYHDKSEKRYLIIIKGIECDQDEKEFKDWEWKIGRQEAYDYIKGLIESDYVDINVHESKIFVDSEKVKLADALSVYEFMKIMKTDNKVKDDTNFDIEDFD